MGFNNLVKKGKDLTVSKTFKLFINSKIANYGKVNDLKVNSTKKEIDLTIDLKGEEKPLSVKIFDYSVKKKGDEFFVEFSRVETSRIWLTNAINDHLMDSKLRVPAKYGDLLGNLL